MGGEEEKKLRDLLLKATRDMEFREEFLKDPVSIGKKHGVSFTKEQLTRIDLTAKFLEHIREVYEHHILPPRYNIVYPLGPILVRWEMDELHLLCGPRPGYPLPPWFPKGYPLPPYRRRRVIP